MFLTFMAFRFLMDIQADIKSFLIFYLNIATTGSPAAIIYRLSTCSLHTNNHQVLRCKREEAEGCEDGRKVLATLS